MAEALPLDGKIVTLELSDHVAEVRVTDVPVTFSDVGTHRWRGRT